MHGSSKNGDGGSHEVEDEADKAGPLVSEGERGKVEWASARAAGAHGTVWVWGKRRKGRGLGRKTWALGKEIQPEIEFMIFNDFFIYRNDKK